MNKSALKEIVPPRHWRDAVPSRAARLPRFVGIETNADVVLDDLSVLVVGLGSVGSLAALHIARQHPREMLLADPKNLKAEGLLTHSLCFPENVGKAKVDLIGSLCARISPDTRIHAFTGPAQELPLLVFERAEVVILATDNLAAEMYVSQRCLSLRKPVIQGSVHGETLVAQVRFLSHRGADSPCAICSFTRDELAALDQQVLYSCQGAANTTPRARHQAQPTASTSFLCTLAADLVVNQLFRHLLGLGKPVTDTLIEYCGYTNETTTTPLTRNPDCRCDHEPFEQMAAPKQTLDECSLDDLATVAGFPNLDTVTFTLGDEHHHIGAVACSCGHREAADRFARASADPDVCPACRGPLHAEPYPPRRTVAGRQVRPLLGRPLREIGAAGVEWVLVRGDERPVLFHVPLHR